MCQVMHCWIIGQEEGYSHQCQIGAQETCYALGISLNVGRAYSPIIAADYCLVGYNRMFLRAILNVPLKIWILFQV